MILICYKKNFAAADGGPLSQVCARLTLRSAPHRHKRKFPAYFEKLFNKGHLSTFLKKKKNRLPSKEKIPPPFLLFW
jgi:hypothetical protein